MSFFKVCRFLKPEIVPIPIDYSGRGYRSDLALCDSYESFMDDVANIVDISIDKKIPYAFLGYSLGSVIAFDVLCRNYWKEKPVHVFFCAEGSLIELSNMNVGASISMQQIEKEIEELGGISRLVRDDTDAYNHYMKLIQNDYGVFRQYKYSGEILECKSATIIYNKSDVTCKEISDWKRVIRGNVNYCEIGEGHFFLNKYYRELANVINESLI